MINFPTREDNILDIILTEDSNIIKNAMPQAPLGNSDHVMITFDLMLSDSVDGLHNVANSETTQNTHGPSHDFSIFNLRKANWQSISDRLYDVNWYDVFNLCTCIDEYWFIFCNILHDILTLSCSRSRNDGRKPRKPKKGIRYTYQANKVNTAKRKSWRKYRRNKSVKRKLKFNRSAVSLKKLLVAQHYRREANIIAKGDRNVFFQYVKSKTKKNTSIPVIKMIISL